ncbi:MAG: S-layer homology domain-containing protein [Lachnospiraceae bacterium]|nr:S-layer homology domain-containing protein [Lachnospiraceae bacterium]MBQ1515735.1 S-layer homology domain-containing protein [Lachnospiraceae bacterium]
MKKQSMNRSRRSGRLAALLLALLMAGSVFSGFAPTALAEEAEEPALSAEEAEGQALPVEETEEPVLAAAEVAEEEPVLTESANISFVVYMNDYVSGGYRISVENLIPAYPGYNPAEGQSIFIHRESGVDEGVPYNYAQATIVLPQGTTSFDLVLDEPAGGMLTTVRMSDNMSLEYHYAYVPSFPGINMEYRPLRDCPGLSGGNGHWVQHIDLSPELTWVEVYFDHCVEIPIGGTADLSGMFAAPEEAQSWSPDIVSMDGNCRATAQSYGRAFIVTEWQRISIQTRFRDVMDPSQFYYDPIYWGADEGITTGYSDGTFRPMNGCNRAAVMAFLYRLAGEPPVAAPSGGSPFNDMSDVNADLSRAIMWGVQEGITTGYADGGFHPWATCNRAAIVTFLWRFAGEPAASSTASFGDMTGNSDFDQAISWAAANGITTGYDGNVFKPWNTCNRLAIMSFLYRYANL